LRGTHFGDKPAGERGLYWWRTHLRRVFGIGQGGE
jgi:hypothetical protein